MLLDQIRRDKPSEGHHRWSLQAPSSVAGSSGGLQIRRTLRGSQTTAGADPVPSPRGEQLPHHGLCRSGPLTAGRQVRLAKQEQRQGEGKRGRQGRKGRELQGTATCAGGGFVGGGEDPAEDLGETGLFFFGRGLGQLSLVFRLPSGACSVSLHARANPPARQSEKRAGHNFSARQRGFFTYCPKTVGKAF